MRDTAAAAVLKPLPASAIWIVVADASHARIFQPSRADSALIEVEALTASRMPQASPYRDDGRGLRSAGSLAQSNAEAFAHYLGTRLSIQHGAGLLQRLYLLTDPPFMSLLRMHLPPSVRAIVAQGQRIDLIQSSHERIRQHLPAQL